MSKTLYSLMLSEDVVREIDLLAHRNGTNRSSMINSIIAEYVHMTTPEGRINEIVSAIEDNIRPLGVFVSSRSRSSTGLSIKSPLNYKYRPSLRYELSFSKEGDTLCRLEISLRTQSPELTEKTNEFYALLRRIETLRLPGGPELNGNSFSLSGARIERNLITHREAYSSDELAKAISDYIVLLDRLFKGYLNGSADAGDIENAYSAYQCSAYIAV